MSARVLVRVAAAFTLLAVLIPTPASAASKKQLEQSRREYRRLQVRLNDLADQSSRARAALDNVEAKLDSTSRSISRTSARVTTLSARLKERVRAVYIAGGLGPIDFLASARSMREFALRSVILGRQSAADEAVLLDMRRARAELGRKRRDLKEQQRARGETTREIRAQTVQIQAEFGRAQTLLARLEGEKRSQDARLVAGLVGMRTRVGGSGNGQAISLGRCPAAGPHAFSNDWGACRGSGCSRRHQGNDILASMGSPAVATVGGVITKHDTSGPGGLSIYLFGDNGVEFYYAHMSGFATDVGARVGAGQLIGYVGNSGNAAGGPAHIHFEVHPGGGSAINPYPSLLRVC